MSLVRALGPYEIVSHIATGGMAEVYVARRRGAYGFTKSVALKRILPQYAKDPEFVSMFIDEARVGAGLSHPNLVEVFDFGEDAGELYIAMELVDGTTCAKLLRAASARGQTVTVEDTLFLVLSVLRALDFAHGAADDGGTPLGLVHRDVSPGNVLVSRSGAIKLADFGIARAAHVERRTEDGHMKGKLGYMSPEQVLGEEVDARSDLFTVGIVLAELLVGRPLFTGDEFDVLLKIRDADVSGFVAHATRVPEDLRAVVLRALARRAEDRYPTAQAFADDLEEIVRRRRLAIGPARLAAYLEHLALVRRETRSQELRAVAAASRSPSASGTQPRRITVPPPEPAQAPGSLYRLVPPGGPPSDLRSLAATIEEIVRGRIGGAFLVSKDGGEPVPAEELPELRRLVRSSSLRWDLEPDDEARVPWLPRSALARMFHLVESRGTALLVVSSEALRAKLFFDDGHLVHIACTDPSTLLGAILMREGLVLPVERDMALAVAPRHGGRLGDALVGLGIVRPVDLYRALAKQLELRLALVLSVRGGTLVSRAGERHHDDAIPRPPSGIELLAEAGLSAMSLELVHELVRHEGASVIRQGPPSALSVASLRLRDEARAFVVGAIERGLTVREVAELARHERRGEDLLRAICLAVTAGAVVLARPAKDTPG